MLVKNNILQLIEEADLRGRGGAAFPVAKKWQGVAESIAKSKKKAYIVVNCSEGEPGVFKDAYILKHHLSVFFAGLRGSLNFLTKDKVLGIYFFTSSKYAKEFLPEIKKELNKKENSGIKKLWHTSLKKGSSYVSGEESALFNVIEFSLIEPRFKPPYPPERGLFACPTLINNLETFYDVGLVISGKYKKERFYSISGKIKNPGVYSLPRETTIKNILKLTNNIPNQDFFVLAGGDMSGEVLNSSQLNRPVGGVGSIRVCLTKESPKKIVAEWLNFYRQETCGHCAPCREGTFRLWQLFKKNPEEFLTFNEEVRNLLENLSLASFCGLGASLPIPLNSYAKNILKIKTKKA